jgi:hypothetical protein
MQAAAEIAASEPFVDFCTPAEVRFMAETIAAAIERCGAMSGGER